jgi:cytochrome P450 family 142 subfamily A polypeptide 1
MRIDSIPRDASGEVFQGVMAAIVEFQSFLTEAVPRLREQPDDSFISVWANAEIGGCPMGAQTIMHETGLFISGGAETTRTAIARGLRAFCDHPDQWERLASDPSLVPDAVDITRTPNPHLAFGFGPHVCIGQSLARLELQVLFGEMARRVTDLRVVTEPVIERNLFAGAVQRFDLAFADRPR